MIVYGLLEADLSLPILFGCDFVVIIMENNSIFGNLQYILSQSRVFSQNWLQNMIENEILKSASTKP